MIGCDRTGVLRAPNVVGTQVGNRTRVGNRTLRGDRTRGDDRTRDVNSTRPVETFLAMCFLVVNHDGVICVAVCVVKRSLRQVGFWSRQRMLQTRSWVARSVTDVEMFLATFTCTSLD